MSPVITEPLHLRESGAAELLENEGLYARDLPPIAMLGAASLLIPISLTAMLLERLHVSESGLTELVETEGLHLRDQPPLARLIDSAASLMARLEEQSHVRDLAATVQLQKRHGPWWK